MLKKFGPGIVWALLIFILSTVSSGTLHLPDFWDLFSLDKAAHAAFYFILFYLWAIGFKRAKIHQHKIYIILLFACITYGILLEFYQACVLTDRTGDWVDALANSIGVVAGYYFIRKKAVK